MIEYIKGAVAELTPTTVVVETAAGVAYELNISLQGYEAMRQQKETKVYVHEVVRDDAWVLYGFADRAEREVFRLLLGVPGVGAASARMILSAIPTAELRQVIATGAIARLKGVKGIGSKTAQRIIVDLKDKINGTDDTLIDIASAPRNDAMDEALGALVMLGFQKTQSQKVLNKIFESDPTLTVEKAIKQALALM